MKYQFFLHVTILVDFTLTHTRDSLNATQRNEHRQLTSLTVLNKKQMHHTKVRQKNYNATFYIIDN